MKIVKVPDIFKIHKIVFIFDSINTDILDELKWVITLNTSIHFY